MKTIIEMSNSNSVFHSGSSNYELARILGEYIIANFKDKDLVFQPVHIITPNKAQHNWLKEQLAGNLGFIANLEQHSLDSFIKKIVDKLFPERKDLPGKGRLVWDLFAALNDSTFKADFSEIATYCGDDEIKRLALAQKVSGLVGEYEQNKPELLQSWKEEKEDKTNPDEAWQASLYRISGFHKALVSAADLKEQLLKDASLLSEFQEIFLFGDLQFSPMQLKYLEVLQGFSEIRMHIFRTNLQLNEENPLVQNWGKLAKKTAEDLQKLTLKIDTEVLLPAPETDLQKIRQDLLTNEDAGELQGDESLLIYNSFTKLREVEALYNYLVKTVDSVNKAGGKLGARDIAVYVPRLDPYIPAIKTVFDTAPHKFPYTLVSKGFSREEGFWSALEQVLEFEEENFTAPAVFNLLESAPIQKSFGFSSDLNLLRKAFLEANIRREYKGNPDYETHFVSFSYGIERLIYGFCLGDETPVEIEGRKIYPVDLFEGAQAQDLFRLHHLVEKLQELLDKKQKDRSVADWYELLLKIAEDFLSPEDWQEQRFSDLMQNLVSLETSVEKIAFKTFYHRLKDHLQQQDVQQIKGRGGIVFCGLYPGQSMPKKVVAFLGLNFKEFPRRTQELSFDLLSKEDRLSSGHTDRGAFLQAFLNVEEKVLFSYIGQNVKDNSEIPASSIISELQDYTEKKGEKIKEVKHALHSYNSKYFKEEEEDYFTYLIGKERKLDFENKEAVPASVVEEVQLFRLVNFLKDPFKHHYNNALGIYYKDTANLPDWEPFDLGPLEKWKVKDSILEQMLQSSFDLEEHRIKMLQEGSLPLKIVGEKALEEGQRKVDLLLTKVREISSAPIDELEFDLEFTIKGNRPLILKCKLPLLGQQGLFLSVSKKKKKYELAAFVNYLAMVAGGKNETFHYVALNRDEDQSVCITYNGLYNPEEAKNHLKSLLEFYVENHIRITPFSPEFEFSTGQLDKCVDTGDEKEVEQLAELIDDKFSDPWGFYPSEYLRTEYAGGFFDEEKNLLEFKHLYKSIMGPVEKAGKTKK